MQKTWYEGATRGQWLALTAALLGWTFDGFEMGVFPIVAGPALNELLRETSGGELSGELFRRWNAVLVAAFLFGAAAGGFVFGWIGDRIGRVRAMTLSVLTYALFTGLCGFATEAWQLAALRFVAALGMGGEWSLGVALVMESWSPHARPVLAGLIGSCANFGFMCTGLVGLALPPVHYWRIILMLCALPALLTFFFRMFVPESEKWRSASASGPRPRMTDIFAPGLLRPSLLGAAAGAVALLASWGGVQMTQAWVSKLDAGWVSYTHILLSLGQIIGSFFGAVLGARFSRQAAYFFFCVTSLAICQYFFLTLASGPFDGWFLFTFFALGIFTAAFYGWLPLYLPELYPTRVRATGQGFCFNFGRSLAAVGVLVMAFGIDLQGNIPRASAIICLVYLVGMALAWFLPETRGKPLPE